MTKASALIVDDEADIRELVEITLTRMGLKTQSAATLAEAHALLAERKFDFCITDMRLPDGNGLSLIQHIQREIPCMPVAMITAYGNAQAAVESLKAGAFDFVSKPVDLATLRKLVDSALKLRKNDTTDTADQELLGTHESIRNLRAMIERLARSQAPVHIAGESGTGKERVAQLIHKQGPRGQSPFMPVNCGAIPTELMESEFFGHVKGSFTGAVRDKQGLFQSAEGGTLFLDEVADLPLHMQVKLLRAVQERSVRPVGAETEVPVNVRIISATHKNLNDLVNQGAFRQDLYYRLNVIEVRTPPLRDRADDIPLLSEHILTRLARDNGLSAPPKLEAQAQRQLREYNFPGNVRELENILERAITMCDGKVISASDLQLRPSAPVQFSSAVANENAALGDHIEEIEKRAIREALEKARYNKTRAAELLGMSFRSLRYRIKKLGIE
ncbi:sigma-54-dependent transcriptional regulator [Stenotrophobium rhamnosiphilum]|uniref:Sigma-54-dependent Fis family transcriptional regulator n=1 Tax=Stenotrophobium rhamnosiphilum TaxID=2029166 RepID=A0A2T5MJH3_9GAMM|nr:sigma-54 dependent transcriptional regulator [Stenotrophobium rhamnosiphilum]PTU32708.1 sigma-54-dependent Fis family transcriptional regulator [Stenotrophobium rhamnosiphilum]